MRFLLVTEPTAQVRLADEWTDIIVPLNAIDWATSAAVIVDLGPQRTGGYRVEVRGVHTERPGEILLDLQVIEPRPGEMVMQVLTHPYAVVAVPRSALGPGAVTIVGRGPTGYELARQVIPR
jgi:hypothetical protein